MAGFALECRKIMRDVTRALERELGPETGDLCMRIGLHSGPVTAGVLRGEKSRFQLFGDTVNTASRMESTGEENLVQLSSATAKLLAEGGKEDWLLKREGGVVAKGKGDMETYWLERKDSKRRRRLSLNTAFHTFTGTDSSSDGSGNLAPEGSYSNPQQPRNNSQLWGGSETIEQFDAMTPKNSFRDSVDVKLIDWNVDILLKLLRQVVSLGQSAQVQSTSGLHSLFCYLFHFFYRLLPASLWKSLH
jgi:hypothetical protein